MTSREQMARIAEPVAGNTLKSSAKNIFMSGKDANDKVWHFEPGKKRSGESAGQCVVAPVWL